MPSTVILKAAGLNTSPNELSIPEGSLSEAKNILIRRDGIIEQRRGFKLYGNSAGSSTETVKQLTVYRNRLLRHIDDTLQYDSDGLGRFESFSGAFIEASESLRMKFIESNGNMYFTSSNGIQKISSKSADNLKTSTIMKAGATKAIDITGRIKYTKNLQTGFLPQDSAVSYRVLWGYKDSNNNLVLGSPSQRELVYNRQLNLMLQDYMNLLGCLDSFTNPTPTEAQINNKNYVSLLGLTINSTTSELRANLIELAKKIDNDILYANQVATAPISIVSASLDGATAIITTSGADNTQYLEIGDIIYLSDFTGVGGLLINGQQVVTDVTATTIKFNSTETGAVVVTGSKITCGQFRAITQPNDVMIPAIHSDNTALQEYLSEILVILRTLPTLVISTSDQLLLDAIDITTSSTVLLDIQIPQDIDSRYFYQLYRSSIFLAGNELSIDDVIPNDELQLVYEAYPTSTEIAFGMLTVEDVTPDDFKGANLYTNNSTGEGILQSNETPPFANDINRYRNVVFYANTRTKHKTLLNLLGVSKMIEDYDNGIIPSITISTATTSNTYKFVTGKQEISTIQTIADVSDSLNGTYFELYSTTCSKYAFYFKTSGGVDSPPTLQYYTIIKVDIQTNDIATTIASALKDKISVLLSDFTVSLFGDLLTVTNVEYGTTTDINDGLVPTGFTLLTTQDGRGEDLTSKTILLSTNVSPAIAVDETARSLVRILNSNDSETVYGFYLSGAFDVPGKMLIESRNLQTTDQFLIVANNVVTGDSFNPTISPEVQISSIGLGLSPLITTSTNHGLSNLDIVILGNTDSTPNVDGIHTVTYVSPTKFTLTLIDPITVVGTKGSVTNAVDTTTSENEAKPNRVYYSKLYQPEAVPVTNYFDVGAEDKPILRIFPLRDSLFVFKEDGLYRISGDSAPFQLNLFDSSFIVTAPDSLTVSNNVIFAWTRQGIQSLTEGGAGVISRAIDDQILKLGSNNYTNFKTATWGVGYESDNSYIVWTVTDFNDIVATKAFRYSTLTQTWTTYEKTNTCGIVNVTDDKLYLGAGDTNYIEQERKSFDRTDFADRELQSNFVNQFLLTPTEIKMTSITGIDIGDVIMQEQTITDFEFNTFLLKLDTDPQVGYTDYVSSLTLIAGDNPRTKLLALATKLDADSGIIATNFTSSISNYSGTITGNTAANPTVITSANHNLLDGRRILITGSNSTPSIDGEYTITKINANTFSISVSVKNPGTSGTWQTVGLEINDLKVCFNALCAILNTDNGVSFNNYRYIDNNTIIEAIITDINTISKHIFVNLSLPFFVGDVTVFKAIPTSFTYSPVSLGDPLSLKHLRESTLMFQTRNITNGSLSFATDLLPEFISVPFVLDGNGVFGLSSFGTGFFGGGSNSAPFRTFIPRQCQRCRFIVLKVEHNVAREDYRLLGASLTGETNQSTRGYR